MKEWNIYKIADIVDEISMGPFGSNIKVENFISEGIPVLNGSNLQGYKLNEESFNYVSEEKANSLGKANAYRGDVVITHRGTLGQIIYIPSDSKFERYVISQSQFRLKLKRDIVRPDFLVYYFHTAIGQHKILMNASQVGVPALARPTSTFREVTLPIPPMDIQNKIMDILLLIDGKLAVNKRINDNLEQQAQALYKSWFVDFEPFEDGEFVESEMGEIPVGWTVVKFSDLTEIPKKTINPQKFPETIFKHYSLPACDNGLIPENQKGKDIMSNKIILQNNTTLFSKLNPRIKRIWFTCEVQPNSICSTEFIPYRATNENESGYIFSIINSEAFYASVMGCVNGATGSHQRFHAEDTDNFLCAYNKEAVNEFSQHIDIILKQMHDLRQENVKLASMRDTLLPKLMSGELKINETDC